MKNVYTLNINDHRKHLQEMQLKNSEKRDRLNDIIFNSIQLFHM